MSCSFVKRTQMKAKKARFPKKAKGLARANPRKLESDSFSTPGQALKEARKALRADEPFLAWQRATRGLERAHGATRLALLKISIEALREIREDLDEHGEAHLPLYGNSQYTDADFRRFLEEAKTALRGKVDAPRLPPISPSPRSARLGTPVQLTAASGPRPLWTVAGFISGNEGQEAKKGIVIRDVTGAMCAAFETESFKAVAVSPDQRTLAIGRYDSTTIIYDIESGQKRVICTGQRDWVRSVLFSPDNQRIYTGGNGRIVAYDAATGKALAKRDLYKSNNDFLVDLAVTSDGALLLIARNAAIHVLDARSLSPLRRGQEEDHYPTCLIAVDSRRIICLPGNFIGIIDAATASIIEKVPIPTHEKCDSTRSLCLALNAQRNLAAVLISQFWTANDEYRLRLQIWSVAPLALLADSPLPDFIHSEDTALGGVSFYPNDEALLVVGKAQTLRIPLTLE